METLSTSLHDRPHLAAVLAAAAVAFRQTDFVRPALGSAASTDNWRDSMHASQAAQRRGVRLPQASLHDRPHLAAALAAAAVAFRQTNAVWAALMLGSAMLREVMGEDPRRWAGASVEAQAKYVLRGAWQACAF